MNFVEGEQMISELYGTIKDKKLLSEAYAVVFVYNEEDLIEDDEHASECITSVEKDMIINSFRRSVQYVYHINGENAFIKTLPKIKKKHKYIFVYSMAQNLNGVGRRSLIPLLCEHYKLVNIGSGFLPSVLSGDKKLMYTLIKPYLKGNIPYTIYVDKLTNLKNILKELEYKKYILKPNDESASIGVELIEYTAADRENILMQLTAYQKKYSEFCIQEYIHGPEIEVPLLFYKQKFYCPGCVEIINSNPAGYLDYDTVKMDAYSFTEYKEKLSADIIKCAKKAAKVLGFNTICRIDFKIDHSIPYIIDIDANPTISFHSSTNYIFRERFNDESAVYRMLLFIGLEKAGLLKPSFDKTEQNRSFI